MLFLTCVGAFSGILFAEEERWTVSFQVQGQGVGSTAVAFAGADGAKNPVLVTVAIHGGDFSQSSLLLGERKIGAKLAGYDAVSRLCFFSPAQAGGVKTPEWLKAAPREHGAILTARTGKVEVLGKTEGWVNRVGGKILPLALLRVSFGGAVPVPGTPLLDESGKVAAVAFQKGENDSCVYAIPAEAVHRVARDVETSGRLVRGWLGLTLRVENEKPLIVRVFPGSPAAEAGIRDSDLITKIGGREVANYADVANAFFYVVPGEAVDVEVRRGQSVLAFTLVPTRERPGN